MMRNHAPFGTPFFGGAFPGYRYTRADWEQENLHLATDDLHTHKLSP